MNLSVEMLNLFCKNCLGKFWNHFHLFVWKTGKPFTSFQGNEMALFVANISTICKFFQAKIVLKSHVRTILKALELWGNMFQFLGIGKLPTNVGDSRIWYKKQIKKYENHTKAFYKAGASTFLSKRSVGSEETCYMHVMRHYVPKISKITLERHDLGIGVFNMQGFERRNKASKNIYKRFSNNKTNVIPTVLGRLHDVFEHEKILCSQ